MPSFARGELSCYNYAMKLVVGFGNPETKYNFTRHNFGFLTLDFYTKIKKLSWEKSEKFNAIWLKTTVNQLEAATKSDNEQIIFIKPQTYYNEVGRSIQAFSHFYKVAPKDILIICDDFNLEFDKIRLREKGSAGGNNGLKSTISELGTDEFPRLRLGTGSSLRAKTGDTDFVLGKFTAAEREKLPDILNEACAKIENWIN